MLITVHLIPVESSIRDNYVNKHNETLHTYLIVTYIHTTIYILYIILVLPNDDV